MQRTKASAGSASIAEGRSAGVEMRIAGGLTAVAGIRLTRTGEQLDVAGAKIEGTFVTSHVDFGVGWRF